MNNTTQSVSQHKNILFIISLPNLPNFREFDSEVMECCQKLQNLGVTVRNEISKAAMKDMGNFDVVIVVAHLDEATDELVLSNSRISIADFISYIPNDFCGFLDFSSCHSSMWNNSIKEKCPMCKVSGVLEQTVLPVRLYLYPYAVQLFLDEKSMSFDIAYSTVKDILLQVMDKDEPTDSAESESDATRLGKKMSSIFAPTEVVKGNVFMVQIMLYDESESLRQIRIQAKNFDSKTHLVETQELPIKIKKGDKISVQFNALIPPEQIFIDNAVKEIIWNGKSGKIQFNVTILEGFESDFFVGKLIIEVNHDPVGESSFSIKVGEKVNLAPSMMDLKVRNTLAEGEEQKTQQKKQLLESIAVLSKQMETAQDEQTKSNLRREIEICKRNLEILDNPLRAANTTRPKKVFISSTREEYMEPFRKTVHDVVSSLKMEPEWCNDWPQSGYPPTDVCCQRVMDSDIYIGIFGGRYGHIDPSLDSSMTQIEYYTALGSHKEILLFIIAPLNKTDEPESIRKRQEDFVKSVRNTRVLKEIKNVDELSDYSRNDLLDLISRK